VKRIWIAELALMIVIKLVIGVIQQLAVCLRTEIIIAHMQLLQIAIVIFGAKIMQELVLNAHSSKDVDGVPVLDYVLM